MEDSILNSTKKILGVADDYTAYDLDIITHINTSLSTLTQLGIGPVEGFMIEDERAVWEDFVEDDSRFNSIKSYVYLKVRRLFDPPNTSYLLDAMDRQIEEFEWRLNVVRENDIPLPPVLVEDDIISIEDVF